jgi:hypothetical protein
MTTNTYLLALLQFLIGVGIAASLQTNRNLLGFISLSMLIGLGVSSIAPLVLEFANIPLKINNILYVLAVMTVLSLLLSIRQTKYYRSLFKLSQFSFKIYEIPFFIFWGYLMIISIWKCWWFANVPFDTLVGPDLVATYAVREGQFVSSVFTQHLPSVSTYSNQPIYAPFTALQQILYLSAGMPFGKLWLTIMIISFSLYLYAELRTVIHPLLVSFLLMFYWCIPEFFAYTFLVQTDYSNAIYFSISIWFLSKYLSDKTFKSLTFSILMMAIACWCRSETIFFVPIGCLLILCQNLRLKWLNNLPKAMIYGLIPAIVTVFWNVFFVKYYLPVPLALVATKINISSFDYLTTFANMNEQVIFKDAYWNYILPFFTIFTLANLIIFRNRQGISILIWIVGVYLIFGLIIQHIEGANIAYTFRRGIFKFFPLIVFYLAESSLFGYLSVWLEKIEGFNTHKYSNTHLAT